MSRGKISCHSARQSQNPCRNYAICPGEHLQTTIDSATNAQNDGVGYIPTVQKQEITAGLLFNFTTVP